MSIGSDLSSLAAIGGSLIGAGALSYYMTRDEAQIDPDYDFENQSIQIDEVEKIRVCKSVNGKPLVEFRFPDVRTIYDVLPKGLEISKDGACLGEREGPGRGPYTWLTYSQVIEQAKNIGSGLLNKGIQSSNSTNIGIYSVNRKEWIISEHACYSFSFPVISLYDTYGKESIKYILNHAEIQVLFVDNFARLKNILNCITELTYLKLLIHFNPLSREESEEVSRHDLKEVQFISFNQLLEIGRSNPQRTNPPKPEDIATICYTSGTTGMPKGAIISHLNMISNEAAINERIIAPSIKRNPEVTSNVHMSYLPLAHMLERMASILTFLVGGQIGFLSADVTQLIDDVQELKPTEIPMVPKMLNRFHDQVMNQVKTSPLKQFLLRRAIAAKNADRKKGVYRKDTIYDRLIFGKIRDIFGGQVSHSATGSAPIADEVMIFARAAFSCPIPEGYGQTEATCSITFCHPYDPNLGHCGAPVASSMVKLVDVPEMGYFADKNQGEICMKGPSRFLGYLKDPEKTKEAIDEDGWLHTGDVGIWLPNGALKIIDRKKNFFKLSQGEYVSPERVESVYLRWPLIAQIIVEGNSLKDFTVAVIVPEMENFMAFCKKLNQTGAFQELCKNIVVRRRIVEELNKFGKTAGLKSFEQVKNVYLSTEQFSVENGLATPTMKIKRLAVREKFKERINSLYDEITNSKAKL